MALVEQIKGHVQRLPASLQAEVLHFVEYLLARAELNGDRREDERWSGFSLDSAMRGMEDEDVSYSEADLKESFP